MATNQGEVAEIYAEITALNEQAIVYAELKLENIIPEEMYQQETASLQYQIKQLRDQKNKQAGDSVAHHKAESQKKLLDVISYHPHTNHWNKHMVKRILEDKGYLGGRYPPIIESAVFARVQKKIVSKAPKVPHSTSLNRAQSAKNKNIASAGGGWYNNDINVTV